MEDIASNQNIQPNKNVCEVNAGSIQTEKSNEKINKNVDKGTVSNADGEIRVESVQSKSLSINADSTAKNGLSDDYDSSDDDFASISIMKRGEIGLFGL